MDPHYPSTAELAAFRRSIWRDRPAEDLNMHAPGAGCCKDGAWPDELRDGIGWRHGSDRRRTDGAWAACRTDSMRGRAEAAALRHRAYLRLARGTDAEYRALLFGVEAFTPAWNPYTDGERR